MGLTWEPTADDTDLDPDEIDGLLVTTITTRAELDEHEQANIQRARIAFTTRRYRTDVLLSTSFVKRVHGTMYDEVWKWAGQFRRTEKNIGVDPLRIATDLEQLLGDARFWVQNSTYPVDELIIRTKHRLVSVHCFSNGNGRHSRFFADLLAVAVRVSPFSWGAISATPDARERYLGALRKADKGDLQPLIDFARS